MQTLSLFPSTHTASIRPAAHCSAADVAAAIAAGTPLGHGNTPLQYLPLFARVAVERLDADCALRSPAMLDELLQGYARFYSASVDLETCAAAHHVCTRRFWDFAQVSC